MRELELGVEMMMFEYRQRTGGILISVMHQRKPSQSWA